MSDEEFRAQLLEDRANARGLFGWIAVAGLLLVLLFLVGAVLMGGGVW